MFHYRYSRIMGIQLGKDCRGKEELGSELYIEIRFDVEFCFAVVLLASEPGGAQ